MPGRRDRKELQRYREDEAAGLLIRLPVPQGTIVWRVRENPGCHYGVQQAEIFLFGKVVTPRKIVEPVPFDLSMLEHTIKKSNPMFIFINGLFGCVFIRDRENEK